MAIAQNFVLLMTLETSYDDSLVFLSVELASTV